MFFTPLARGDFKNFFIQFILIFVLSNLSSLLTTFAWLIIPAFYNKIYIKGLLQKGYKPKDNHAVEILNTLGFEYEQIQETTRDNLKSNESASSSTNFGNYYSNDNSIDNLDYIGVASNKSNKEVRNFTSNSYDSLIKQKDDLYIKIQNMHYGIKENINKYKSVLNELLELSPNDKVFQVLLDEINLKEEYLISFYELQSCINILNNPRDLTADVFNDFLNEIKDIHLPKLKESEEKNIMVCNTSSFELESYIEEKTAQYKRKLKREEKEYKDKKNYVVFDLETTGLSSSTHEITEIGAIKVIDGEVADKFEMLVKPTKKITKKITEITGITNEMVEDKPPIEEVLPQFIEFIGKLPLVAHNADFDSGFLCENYRRIYGKEFRRKKSCTMKMYRKWYKETWDEKAPSAKLGDVIFDLLGSDEYSSYLNNAHRGLNDAEFTQKIYEKMI